MIETHDYTIDEKYIFEQKTSLIYLKDDRNQNIELSKPAARLLNQIILLNLKKGIATRDELLTSVWEEYGLVGSNNNLNTYISEIRKKLEQVGIDPKSIVTVPKKGFRLDNHIFIHENVETDNKNVTENTIYLNDKYDYIENPEYSPQPIDNPLATQTSLITIIDKPLTAIDNTENNHTQKMDINETLPLQYGKDEIIKKSAKKPLKILLLVISTLAICYLIYLFTQHPMDKTDPANNYLTVSTNENCVIQMPIDMVGNISSDNIAIVNKKLNKYNIPCNEPKRIILLSDLNKSYSIDKNISISICKEINKKFDCISINDQRI
ncbi:MULTISPECIES: winged helix-turn-helix domain-containing protein [Providencia]|uniref:Winged helix-turn-helix domain-containing protein n=1 Tax=Providencia rettgeri TaxID=587 RepID=A0A3R9CL87_PRORE|nr:helix-turn-helix domain-containing protein [Providencia rettgeri]ELR5218814.1 winged helix-turn-helix domain-containing protein [Providencia rettgeri]MBV2188446.1 helix-turn-helix domain-containing protein [Providencia rettgeri]HEC8326222.1 winged helix-turn-helix domain-containing protein [Providencia rettgeri]